MNITNQQILSLDALVGKYSGSMQPGMSAENIALRSALLERVRKFTKFSYALGRNLNIIKPIMLTLQADMKNEKLEAFQRELDKLTSEGLEPAKFNARAAKIRLKHGAEKLVTENNRRYGELMELDVQTPIEFYKIPITALPGWNDADDCTEDDRRGAIGPLDISLLLDIGILYDENDPTPAEAPTPSKPKKKSAKKKPAKKKPAKKKRG